MLVAVLAALVLAAPEVAFVLADPRIDESSGLVAASSGEAVFTHGDSGDDVLTYYTVDLRGRTLARTRFPDQDARDVEDAALGPGPSLYLADIGDNSAVRPRVLVHRLPEPAVDTGRRDRDLRGEGLTSASLTYEDGPRDAEALLVHPATGQVVIVTKSLFDTAVYAAPLPLADGVLRRDAALSVPASTTPGGPDIGPLARVLVTGGAVSADGRRAVLRTYTDALVYEVPGEDLLAALRTTPVAVPLPETGQGEGITWTRDGTALLVSTEGERTPVHRVPVPAGPGEPDPGTPAAGDPPPVDAAPGNATPRDATDRLRRLAGGVAVLLAAAYAVLRRSGRRGRRARG